MKTYNIYDAKANLSKLIKKAKAGESFYVGAYGEPEVLISAAKPIKKRKFGAWTGMIDIPDEKLVGLDPEIQELVYGKDWDKK